MTPSRWFGAAVTTGLLTMLISLSLETGREAAPVPSEPLAAAVRQLTAAVATARSAVQEYRFAQALDRWRRARDADPGVQPARLDADVHRAIADPVLETVREQWSRLGGQSPR